MERVTLSELTVGGEGGPLFGARAPSLMIKQKETSGSLGSVVGVYGQLPLALL